MMTKWRESYEKMMTMMKNDANDDKMKMLMNDDKMMTVSDKMMTKWYQWWTNDGKIMRMITKWRVDDDNVIDNDNKMIKMITNDEKMMTKWWQNDGKVVIKW